MNDLEVMKEMLALANLRYSVSVMPELTTVIVAGHRDGVESHLEALGAKDDGVVEIYFDAKGTLVSLAGRRR